MRNLLKTTISLLALVSFLGLSSSAFGVASFARQTGLDCTSCHAGVGFPLLNSFGKAFKAGGYVQGNEDNMIGDGDMLSIPANLNISAVLKARAKYVTTSSDDGTNTTDTTVGKLEIPDEGVLFIAGRVGKSTGWLVEWEGEYLSFRMPFTMDIGPGKLGIVPWMTDAGGPGWVMENQGTGAAKHLRGFESKFTWSALSMLYNDDIDGNAAAVAGVGAYYWTPMFHVAVSPTTNDMNGGNGANGIMFAPYVRAVVTPTVAGLDLGIGVQYLGGLANCCEAYNKDVNGDLVVDADGNPSTDGGTPVNWDFLGLDVEVQGEVGGMPLFVSITYAMMGADFAGNAIPLTHTDDFNTDGVYESDKVSRLAIGLIVGVVPEVANIMLGFNTGLGPATHTTDAFGADLDIAYTSSKILVGAEYYIHRNIRLQVEYDMVKDTMTPDGGDTVTESENTLIVMLFGSF